MCAYRPAAISQDAPVLTRRPSKKVTSVKAAKSTTASLSAHNHANVSDSEQLRVVPEPGPIRRNVNFSTAHKWKNTVQKIKRAHGTMQVTSFMKTLPSC